MKINKPSAAAVRQWAGIAVVLGLVGWTMYAVSLQGARVDALAEALTAEQSAAESRGDEPVAPQTHTYSSYAMRHSIQGHC